VDGAGLLQLRELQAREVDVFYASLQARIGLSKFGQVPSLPHSLTHIFAVPECLVHREESRSVENNLEHSRLLLVQLRELQAREVDVFYASLQARIGLSKFGQVPSFFVNTLKPRVE